MEFFHLFRPLCDPKRRVSVFGLEPTDNSSEIPPFLGCESEEIILKVAPDFNVERLFGSEQESDRAVGVTEVGVLSSR